MVLRVLYQEIHYKTKLTILLCPGTDFVVGPKKYTIELILN
jgi:hypothetical protein